MGKKSLGLDSQLYEYLLSISLREAEILTKLRHETDRHRGKIMQISPDQGQFMAMLVKLLGAKKTLDIGVFTGYSSLVVALALPEDGIVVACDRDPSATEIARRYWQEANVEHKIDFHLAPALETLDNLIADGAAGSFDFAFIDADKRNYGNYYERCLTLLRHGGIVAIDNVLWSGRVVDSENLDKRTIAIREFNQKVYGDKRVDVSTLSIADGLTLARKR
ncbi:MAG: class I SAM-dependent methyltransferase [Cyanobacteria bacterium P01_G01_bin.19]